MIWLLVVPLLWPPFLLAAPVENLEPARELRLKDLSITGNDRFSDAELLEILSTKPSPWYTPWRSPPRFDREIFNTDLERLERFYQAKGYYEAKISHDLQVEEGDLVSAVITISEGEPVRVAAIVLNVSDHPELVAELEALRPVLPLKQGDVFAEEIYQQTEAGIQEHFLERGRGRVKVERKAEVIRNQRTARVFYQVEAGPLTVFGATHIEGLKDLAPALALRELAYRAGERFSMKALRESRQNLLDMDLFTQVQLLPGPSPADPTIIPVVVKLEEKPPREIRMGIGYGTEDQLRGQARWQHNNWLGGARRLEVGGKVSFIAREGDIHFLQPHFRGRPNRFSFTFKPLQVDEPGFFLNAARVQPRLERKFSPRLIGFVEYRIEHDRWSQVPRATLRRLREFPREGNLSGLSLGLLWNTADDPLNPTRGWIFSLLAEQAGGFLSGSFDFHRLQGEAKNYYPLASGTVLASRLKLGFADPFDGSKEIPIFERFFSGGSKSVRGYGRHRLGPLSAANDPIGGRSLIEGALEVRQRLTETIGGALFLDFGQVSLRSFDLPLDDLRFAAGFGVSYATPVGPLRLDLGFPFSPARKDRTWQIHFSIGQFF